MTGLGVLALARSTIDRAAHRRTDELLAKLLADPATQVLPVRDGRSPVTTTEASASGLSSASSQTALQLRPPRPEDADRLAVFLGADVDGVDYVAVAEESSSSYPTADAGSNVGSAAAWAGLRDVGAVLGARDAGLLTQAVALLAWHRTHTHCPRCGASTRITQAGYARRCDVDASDHYPRTDPAVIMTVRDGRDRLLLGHQASWPVGRYSTLAGFVEPGEPLEAAVRREVFEESGIVVGRTEYLGSQPWPFPASIMLGFHAYATSEDITVDGVEIEHARWFTRNQLTDAIAATELRLPPRVSIARALIEDWFGGPLSDDGDTWR